MILSRFSEIKIVKKSQNQWTMCFSETIFIYHSHDRGKILALQDQMIRDIEEGHIDEGSVTRTVQKIINVKKLIAVSPRDERDLTELTKTHLDLIEEMNSYLL